jgi:HPt (histidine-containing phosphotransfer) domain-containing protein
MPPAYAYEILDFQELARQFGGNAAFARELLSECADELPGLVGAVREAAGRDDRPSVAAEAHALKGIFANLRLPALRAAAAAVESCVSAGSADDIREAAARLELEAGRFRSALPGIPA